MGFDAQRVALELVAALREPADALARHDADLARQLRRAATSVALNVAEGARRQGKDRKHLFTVAAGSAAEVRTALAIARGWGYLPATGAERVDALLDRELAMLWRLTH